MISYIVCIALSNINGAGGAIGNAPSKTLHKLLICSDNVRPKGNSKGLIVNGNFVFADGENINNSGISNNANSLYSFLQALILKMVY